jgi:hypothetical protein
MCTIFKILVISSLKSKCFYVLNEKMLTALIVQYTARIVNSKLWNFGLKELQHQNV